jgi:hypothetical protein
MNAGVSIVRAGEGVDFDLIQRLAQSLAEILRTNCTVEQEVLDVSSGDATAASTTPALSSTFFRTVRRESTGWVSPPTIFSLFTQSSAPALAGRLRRCCSTACVRRSTVCRTANASGAPVKGIAPRIGAQRWILMFRLDCVMSCSNAEELVDLKEADSPHCRTSLQRGFSRFPGVSPRPILHKGS